MTITYLQADELHSGLEIETVKDWRRVVQVDRARRRVQVTIDTGLTMMFPARQMFKTRDA
jgi:hypothetical protein